MEPEHPELALRAASMRRKEGHAEMTSVVLTQHEQIEQAITEALGHLQLEPLVRDKVVAVKPHDTWASAEGTTAVTQPDTMPARLRYVKQFSPKQLIVTGGSAAGQTDEIFSVAGFA